MPDNQERPAGGRRPRGLTYVSAAGVALGLTALGTAGLAGSAGAADRDRPVDGSVATGDGVKTITVEVPVAPSASPSPTPTVNAAQMRLAVSYKRVGKVVKLTINLDGYVFEPLDAKNVPVEFPTPATAAIGLGEDLAWGDGTTNNSAARPWHCGTPVKVHQVKDGYTLTKTYDAGGMYTITYTFRACGLTDGKITASIPLKF
jgi:hypothetical protein